MGGISDLLSSTLESIGSVKRVVKTVTSGYTLKATTVDDDGSIIHQELNLTGQLKQKHLWMLLS